MPKDFRTCVFRVEAGNDHGIGHFRRCIVLGEILINFGIDVAFVMSPIPANLKKMAEARHIRIIEYQKATEQGSDEDAEMLAAHLRSQRWDWLVFDGYNFRKSYRNRVKQYIKRILVIQDLPGDYSDADLVLDQNVNIDINSYGVSDNGLLLAGPKYSLVSGDQNLRKKRFLPIKEKPTVLVTLGGSDVNNLTYRVIECLAALEADINVVLGPSSKWLRSDFNKYDGKITVHVSPDGLDELIAQADIGVMSMGITTWEMCFYGLPFIMLPCNPMQETIVRWFTERDLAVNGLLDGKFIDEHFVHCIDNYLKNPISFQNYSEKLMQIVDGKGPQRVAEEMRRRS